MEDCASARLFDAFAHVSDPRRVNARHRLFDIFVIALCAVISGAEGWEDMEEYGQPKQSGFSSSWNFPMAFRHTTPFVACCHGSSLTN
jgi:hypothetical protein